MAALHALFSVSGVTVPENDAPCRCRPDDAGMSGWSEIGRLKKRFRSTYNRLLPL